jgi:alpha-D-xyloside xylohydrolase
MELNSHRRKSFLSEPTLTITTKPFLCTLAHSQDDRMIWRLNAIRFRTKAGAWEPVDQATIREETNETLHLDLINAQNIPITLKIELKESLINFEIEADPEQVAWLAVDLSSQPHEHYLGFGERFDSLDQRGKEVDLWVEDGAQCGLTYFPIPFYISTAGYGLLIDTDVRCIVRMATHDDPEVVSIRNAASSLKLTLFTGATPKDILSTYTGLAGRPQTPPDWVFGPWKSRDWQTADQIGIQEDVEKQLELGLPATVKLIDARWETAYHTFQFDPRKFPDPQAMIDHIHDHGSRLVVWISPWMAVDNYTDPNDFYYDCLEKGYFIKNPQGEAYVSQLGLNPMLVGSCIDFTNPEAVNWWQENIRRLAEMGVDGFNTDFGEQIPEDAVFFDGRTGREMHNIYPRLYNKITFEAMQTGQPGMLLARAGWHGSQRLSAIWAGDQSSDFAYNSGLRTAIIAGQSAGASGFPYWGCDIGGYFGNPTDEVYMRWIQLGAFSPIMMVHGAGLREPWAFSEQTLDVYRRYARLHTDLFPYIKYYADLAAETGVPIMRAMPLEFPGYTETWGELAEHQYCFGSELLVAPVHYGFSRVRPVYLPEGDWRDFWSGALLSGGRVIQCKAEIDQIPVFARTGSIIPLLDPTPDTLMPAMRKGVRPAGHDLRIDIYPGADGRFKLSDGTEFIWHEVQRMLEINQPPVNYPASRQVSVRLVGEDNQSPLRAEADGERVESTRGSLNGEPDYWRLSLDQPTITVAWP